MPETEEEASILAAVDSSIVCLREALKSYRPPGYPWSEDIQTKLKEIVCCLLGIRHDYLHEQVYMAQNEAQAKAAFDAVCGDLPNARYLVYDASCDTITAAIGYAYDLIMVERLSSEEGPEASNLNAALFETGRLVLLVPPKAVTGPIKRAAIAWNSSAQTSRAIKSSLPLLQAAQDIILLTVSGAVGLEVDLLLDYLAAYNLTLDVQAYDSERLTARARGRALIKASSQAGADLLIMGAFGESQAAAIGGLGRATRKIVTAVPMPVLLQS